MRAGQGQARWYHPRDVPPDARAARGTKERTQRPRIKKWNHGAPLSKKPQCPDIGHGNHPNSKETARTNNLGRKRPWGKKDDVLTTVPIPCKPEDVSTTRRCASGSQSMTARASEH